MKQNDSPRPPQLDPVLRSRYERLWMLIEQAIEAKIPLLLQDTEASTQEGSSRIDPVGGIRPAVGLGLATAIRLLESAVRSLARAQECRMKIFASAPPAEQNAVVTVLPDAAPSIAARSNSSNPSSARSEIQDAESIPSMAPTPIHPRPQSANQSASNDPKIITNGHYGADIIQSNKVKIHNSTKTFSSRSLALQSARNPPAPPNPSAAPRNRSIAANPRPVSLPVGTDSLLAQLSGLRGSYSHLRELAAVPI